MFDLKRRLAQGEKLVGTMVNLMDHPDLARILKICGLDFFMIDCEHGYFDPGAAGKLFGLAREAGMPPFVRIPEVRRDLVLTFMEMGAAGILLPQTDTVEQAQKLVQYAKYAPLGSRGVSLLRPHSRYEPGSGPEYMKTANDETVLMVQIESETAVEHVEQILAVPGIDVAFVGPADLSQSLGIMGQTEHPRFVGAVERIVAAAQREGKFAGIHFMAPAPLRAWMAKGMSFNLLANEITFMMSSAREWVQKVRA